VKQAEAAQQPLALYINGLDSGNPPSGIDFDNGQVTFIRRGAATSCATGRPSPG